MYIYVYLPECFNFCTISTQDNSDIDKPPHKRPRRQMFGERSVTRTLLIMYYIEAYMQACMVY